MKISVILTSLLFVYFHSDAQWVSKNGPEGGGIAGVAATSTTIFAGISSIGIYRSKDGGATWIPSNTEPTLQVSDLHVSGNTVFAGVYGTHSLIRSADQGLTWQPANDGIKKFQSVKCFAENEAGIWIGTGEGILLSTNKGDTWIDRTGDIGQKDIRDMTTKGNKVFAGTINGLFVTSNSGVSWTRLEITGAADGAISAVNTIGNKIFVSLMNGGVYASVDDGVTWVESGDGIVSATPAQFLQVGDKIYAPGVMSTFVSSNNGVNWSTTGINGILVGSMISFNGKLIAGSYPDGIMVSTNGTDWTFSNTGLHGNTTDDLIMVGDKMFVATAITGVFETTNNGGWKDVGISSMAPLLLAAKGDSIYVGGNAGLRLSTDKGATWRPAGLDGEYILDIEFAHDAIYAISPGKVFVSTNKGATWTSKTSGLPEAQFNCVAVKGDRVFVGIFAKGVYMSTNKGDTWTEVNTGFTRSSDFYGQDILVYGENLYVATSGRIFLSTNNAASWEPVTGNSDISANFLMSTGSHIYAATDKGVFVSGVNSNVWHNINFNLGTVKATTLLSTPKTIIVGTNGLGIMEMPKALPSVVTPNEGVVGATITITGGLFGASADKNVVTFNGKTATVSTAEVMKLQVKVPEGATSGPLTIKVGDITIDAGLFTIRENPVTGIEDREETMFVVSPNPFHDAITINKPGTVHLRLMDTVGKTILQSHVRGRVELPGLAAGVYFATITANGNSQTVKVMKVE